MDYTRQELDRACADILDRAGIPKKNVEIMQQTLTRPNFCKAAAEEAFKGGFTVASSLACSTVRAALNDLDEHGQFQFRPEI